MRIVVALGGNALLRRGEKPDAHIQLEHITAAARALAPLAREHELLLCHGNGPQVGLLALESESDPSLSHGYPLDALVAQTQGMIGYWLGQSLRNAGVDRPVISIVTQVVVDAADPAFALPSKFVGAMYEHDEAAELADARGWSVSSDGAGWRRVVPSPEPLALVEQDTVLALLGTGAVVVCAGGGGAPVVSEAGQLRGVEAVVDKDLTAALLATTAGADRLLILTDVPAVLRNFGTPEETAVSQLRVEEIADLALPAGSMGPKVEACRRFVTASGGVAIIGALADVDALLAGTAGTKVTR